MMQCGIEQHAFAASHLESRFILDLFDNLDRSSNKSAKYSAILCGNCLETEVSKQLYFVIGSMTFIPIKHNQSFWIFKNNRRGCAALDKAVMARRIPPFTLIIDLFDNLRPATCQVRAFPLVFLFDRWGYIKKFSPAFTVYYTIKNQIALRASNSKFRLMAPLLPENAGPVSGKNSSLKRADAKLLRPNNRRKSNDRSLFFPLTPGSHGRAGTVFRSDQPALFYTIAMRLHGYCCLIGVFMW
jgi:hypothetical protein